ncbi:tetratricopeptide repeat protein [Pseudanabaena sp. FACHB-2040]|uniref:tetratricopeptide repeat protein n=1 Tax=Pseudanabaena sp. FACHB-2040 TaxID=2692859 RepID=UPI0016822CE7|nr:tetratricopeptide repeat protein [Pseudanabaena sp. FACHB-2040]MBD2259748.1 tetratricopeptide repeat protein [Pseudanabaena sp. FACHB-2040]
MGDRYLELIDRIVTATLKGQIRSKEQVYEMLQADIEAGTGEIFERCLQEYTQPIEADLTADDEMKQAKAMRKQRALKTIQSEWERWQQENQDSAILSTLMQALTTAAPEDRLSHILQALDPNQPEVLTRDQVADLVKMLRGAPSSQADAPTSADLAAGLAQGLKSWQQLEGNVVGWIYEQGQQALGFGNTLEQRGPWSFWAKVTESSHLKRLFADLGKHQTITPEGLPIPLTYPDWIELAFTIQRLELSLIAWFDKQPYDPKAGKRLSIATFLTFAVVWSELSSRFKQLGQSALAEGCFQLVLQGLYQFSQQDYFPLYGGLFTALSGEPLKTLLDYLDQPLRQVPNTQAKARILTLLGYSQRALGQYRQALQFHERALESARSAGDQRCEIANLNHLSRTGVMQKDYDSAISYSQRALILARQAGDRVGEANALANLGYSEVFRTREQSPDVDQYESILTYLQQGLKLSEQVGDRPSQALCANSLGVAQVMLAQYPEAIASLETGLQISQAIGDMFSQAMNYAYMAEAYRGLDTVDMAVYTASLSMYLLYQINSEQWRQPAGLLSILYGQIGAEAFQEVLGKYRVGFLRQIGVDGFDYLPKLLAEYRQSL